MRKPEILPPTRRNELVPRDEPMPTQYRPPEYRTPDPIESIFIRARARRDAKNLNELTVRNQSYLDFEKSETSIIEEARRRHGLLEKYRDEDEQRDHSRELRRIEHSEKLDAAYHAHVLNQGRHEADLTKLQIVLTDVRQELEAQVEHGGKHHALMWQKRLLDAELDVAAKREMIRQLREPEQQTTAPADDILSILIEHRAMLNSMGADTSRIDAMIKERKR